jgi:hypothetical protein
MLDECQHHAGSLMRIASPGSAPRLPSGASSATPRRASCVCCAAEKNVLWHLRPESPDLLRPQDPPGPRPLLRRYPRLPGGRGPAGVLPHRETGEAALVGRQPLLHPPLRLLRGPALSFLGHPRHRPRAAPRLEDCQSPGDGVHARATPPGGDTGAPGHRYRRDLHPQGAHLPHRGQRPGARATHLVRRPGPFRGESGRVLRLAGPPEMPENPPGGPGHVAGVPQLDPQGGERPAGRHPVRQVPCPQTSGRGDGQGAQARICPSLGGGPAFRQGAEVHVAVALGEPFPRREKGVTFTRQYFPGNQGQKSRHAHSSMRPQD